MPLTTDYRGFVINYNEDFDKFECQLTADDPKIVKENLSTLKKKIDEWLKDNQNFKPIKVVTIKYNDVVPEREYTLIGQRKDGRYVYLDKNGNKQQLGTWDEKYCFLYLEENDSIIAEAASISAEIELLRDKIKRLRGLLNLIPLSEINEQ